MSNKPSIAISGKSGCGNSTVSRLCAEKLGIKLVNFTFRQLALERQVSFEQLCQLAEKDSSIDRELDQRQVAMAEKEPTVLGSRLAIWMHTKADVKVFLEASPEVRAKRIFAREGGSLEQKMRETEERDRRDHLRYLEIYNIDNNQYSFVDLTIQTDRLSPEEIADMIVQYALQKSSISI